MIKTKQLTKRLLNSLWHKQIQPVSGMKIGIGAANNSKLNVPNIADKICSKHFHTSPPIQQNENRRNVQTKIFTISNPFNFLSLKIKTFLMRAYFDPKFTENEFTTGARQGVLFITEKIASGNFKDLNDVMTTDGLQCAHQLYDNHYHNSSNLVVEDSDIMKISVHDIGFEYGESGQKWAFILIICYCSGKKSFTKTETEHFHIDIMSSQPRIVKVSFCREYTPGVDAGWLVDQIDYKNMLKL